MMLAAACAVVLLASPPALGASLRLVSEGRDAAATFDERFAVYAPADGIVRIWDERGRTRDRAQPAGCERRALRFPRLVFACPGENAEQPVVLDVTSGFTQTPQVPPADDGRDTRDEFYAAGRYWLLGN